MRVFIDFMTLKIRAADLDCLTDLSPKQRTDTDIGADATTA
jgi:hypothetical protein